MHLEGCRGSAGCSQWTDLWDPLWVAHKVLWWSQL